MVSVKLCEGLYAHLVEPGGFSSYPKTEELTLRALVEHSRTTSKEKPLANVCRWTLSEFGKPRDWDFLFCTWVQGEHGLLGHEIHDSFRDVRSLFFSRITEESGSTQWGKFVQKTTLPLDWEPVLHCVHTHTTRPEDLLACVAHRALNLLRQVVVIAYRASGLLVDANPPSAWQSSRSGRAALVGFRGLVEDVLDTHLSLVLRYPGVLTDLLFRAHWYHLLSQVPAAAYRFSWPEEARAELEDLLQRRAVPECVQEIAQGGSDS